MTRCVTMDLKEAGNLLFLVGVTRSEMGGSHLALVRGVEGGTVPRVRLEEAAEVMGAVHRAISGGLVRACHDLSEGGAAAALAEMAFAGCLGVEADLVHAPCEGAVERDEALLFAESPSRFLCEVAEADADRFREALAGIPHAVIGRVTAGLRLVIRGLRERVCVDADIEDLREAFLAPLRDGAAPVGGVAS